MTKAKTKPAAGSTPRLGLQRSTLLPQRLKGGADRETHLLHPSAGNELPPRRAAWDFGKIPIHPPGSFEGNADPGIADQARMGQGRPLDPAVRASVEPIFHRDFSAVRVHSDRAAAQSANRASAVAYTVGNDIVFGSGLYSPGSTAGRELIAHELAHVVQQSGGLSASSAGHSGAKALEVQADRAAAAMLRGSAAPALSAAPVGMQRRVSMRDVGRGEQSGFARVGELVERLNRMSKALAYAVTAGFLTYTRNASVALSEFERQMMEYIDAAADIPMRFTNRHGLLGNRTAGFHQTVDVDTWHDAYVDIDDLLASSDIGLQTSLVHLLRERGQTSNYARRIGTDSLDDNLPGPKREFDRAHASGINAEVDVLRDFLGDPSVRIIDANSRLLRNRRGDTIRERETAGHGAARQGTLAITWIVVLHDTHRTISIEEYRDLLAAERARQQAEQNRLQGLQNAVQQGGPGGQRPPLP